ncbi:hypothetical protein HWV23_14595 [Natronomonas halophila]|uniref:hypothetical protein n=1 Tax=Natronomonas halophila TaxID=2747817 RepID=UPI0015B4451A|nr:hypothetical protein [Natronomonas halophila]QLD86902.1 hypothetical protein HWV23_14595 [Natronomonas halophila]
MVPGFVQLGLIALLFQLTIIGGFYGYLRYRHPVADSSTRRRVMKVLAGGACLLAIGQAAALGALGSLMVTPLLSFEQALFIQDAGLFLTLVGYIVVFAGFVLHSRASVS